MRTRSNLVTRVLLASLTTVACAAVACTPTESTQRPTGEGANEPANSASLGVPAPGQDGLVGEMIIITDVESDVGGFEVHPVIESGKVIDGTGFVAEGSIEPATSASLGMLAPGCEGLIDEMVVLDDTEAIGSDDIQDPPVLLDREVVQGKDPVDVEIHDLPEIQVEPVEPVEAPSLPPNEDTVTTARVENRWACDGVQTPHIESDSPMGSSSSGSVVVTG